jgi:hypothetical protein
VFHGSIVRAGQRASPTLLLSERILKKYTWP